MATLQPTPAPAARWLRRIRRLPKEVVDRIAAGEVVERPVSVVKELIENSLDADGTQINVQCQRGGLDSIAVTDNGVGIPPCDLPLACTRFATSKIIEADDLRSIRTFGFRGEALASASMVARVAITSRIRPPLKNNKNGARNADGEMDKRSGNEEHAGPSNCGYKMQYRDGGPDQMANPKLRPRPSAGQEGTLIQVQDLFYNIPSRQRAMEGSGWRGERDEYSRILSVVQSYAVHEAGRGVGFLCRGGGGSKGQMVGFGSCTSYHTDLNTQSLTSVRSIQERRKRARSSPSAQQWSTEEEQIAATKDVIGIVFGTALMRELLPLKAGEGDVQAVSVAALKALPNRGGDASSSAMHRPDRANGSTHEKREPKYETTNDFTNLLQEEMMIEGEASNDEIKAGSPDDLTRPDGMDDTGYTTTRSKFAFAYRAVGLVTNGSYSASKSSAAFLLFINGRLVESSSIRRSVESVYSGTLPKGGKPFVYLSLELPGPHIDVNVHPTKREVAFLHEDRLCDAVSKVVKEVIGGATTSRTFNVAMSGELLPKEERSEEISRGKRLIENSAAMKSSMSFLSLNKNRTSLEKNGSSSRTLPLKDGKENMVNIMDMAAANDNRRVSSLAPNAKFSHMNHNNKNTTKEFCLNEGKSDKLKTSKCARDEDKNKFALSASTKMMKNPLETKKETYVASIENDVGPLLGPLSQASSKKNAVTSIVHEPGCPFASNASRQVDMNMPGAFSLALCRCQVEQSESLPLAPNDVVARCAGANKTKVPCLKKIIPTQCDYKSIGNLRECITNLNHQGLNEKLRDSTYIGAVSRNRSLIQCSNDLIMINHQELAREMYYQIAVMKFGGMTMTKLGGGGVDVTAAIGQMLQFEEDMKYSSGSLKNEIVDKIHYAMRVNKTNADLVRQAVTCFAERAPMLEEYFSIKFEKVEDSYSNTQKQKQANPLRITGLPILLEGHTHQPHALPLFLLRLATVVDWTEEQLCFQGVCAELALFYSELPLASRTAHDAHATDLDGDEIIDFDFIDHETKEYVKHVLFPAISFLLVPPQSFAESGAVVKLANLTSLYRVFERC